MKQCINPETGYMMGRYEFNLLTPEEKVKFEIHLLECDVCYQEFYEFSSIIETIKENIGEFREAVAKKNIISNAMVQTGLYRLIVSARKYFFNFKILPRRVQWIIPIAATAVIVIGVIHLFLSESKHLIKEKTPTRIVSQEPEEMPLKGLTDQYTPFDSAGQVIEKSEVEEKLSKGMTVQMDAYKNNLVFSWPSIVNVRCIRIRIIGRRKEEPVFMSDEIEGTLFKCPIEKFKRGVPYLWVLSGMTVDGWHFEVKKEFLVDMNHTIFN